jgi:hypothetical protein
MEEIEEKRIEQLSEIAEKLLDQRQEVLNNYDIGDDYKDELVGKTDELLSVIILGIGGKNFDDNVTKEVE